jgi:hypothetical protein
MLDRKLLALSRFWFGKKKCHATAQPEPIQREEEIGVGGRGGRGERGGGRKEKKPFLETHALEALRRRLLSPCSRHLRVLASAAVLAQPSTSQRKPPPWLMHLPLLPFAVLLQLSTVHRTPPPWPTHSSVLPCAHFPHPATSQRRPPPCYFVVVVCGSFFGGAWAQRVKGRPGKSVSTSGRKTQQPLVFANK